MELRTVEVRWFNGGPCPEAVKSWFHDGPRMSEPERRTDEYLVLPDRDDLGVKQRGGTMLDLKMLDLKLRRGSVPDVSLPVGLAGQIEAWTKWSFSLDTEVARPAGASWVPVEKTRWSRLYEVTDEALPQPVHAGSPPDNGCAAELVEVQVGLHRSWGFGFEAYGADLEAGAVLEAAMSRFVQDTPLDGLTFDAADSHSYPSWLRRWPVLE